jgi:hypothetical protein
MSAHITQGSAEFPHIFGHVNDDRCLCAACAGERAQPIARVTSNNDLMFDCGTWFDELFERCDGCQRLMAHSEQRMVTRTFEVENTPCLIF